MKVSVSKSEIRGRVSAPASKSYTIRGLMCAALARGKSEIFHPLSADDTEAASEVLTKVGIKMEKLPEVWRVVGGNFHQPEIDLHCGDSAATLRFMTAIGSVIPGRCRLVAGPSLAKRPVKTLIEALRQLGVKCSARGDLPPVIVEGGSLQGGTTELPGDISSQFVSALLLVSPLAKETVEIRLTTPLESKPYVLMTLECLEKFGIKVKASDDLRQFEVIPQTYHPAKYVVEGDWSSAAYFLALGAAAGEVEVNNLNPQSRQGDKVILDFLRQMGATLRISRDSITVERAKLKAIRADLTDCIDLLPTVAVLAALAEGTSELNGISRARLKESDRVAALREGLGRMGIEVKEAANKLTITGSTPRGAIIDSKGDHRIAMAFSILGVSVGNTVIDGAECVSKTFPEFWGILKSINGRVKIDGE